MMPMIASTNANALPTEGRNDLEGDHRDSLPASRLPKCAKENLASRRVRPQRPTSL